MFNNIEKTRDYIKLLDFLRDNAVEAEIETILSVYTEQYSEDMDPMAFWGIECDSSPELRKIKTKSEILRGITLISALVKKSDNKNTPNEKHEIPLQYASEDFGVVSLWWEDYELFVEIKKGDNYFQAEHRVKQDFYKLQKNMAQEFKHVKDKIKTSFPNFIAALTPKIKAFVDEKPKPKVDIEVKGSITEEEREEAMELLKDPCLLTLLNEDMEKRITGDVILRNVILLAEVSAYTHNALNIFVKGDSSSGKTYNVIEVSKYFPNEDVWVLNSLSPTAFYYENGTMEEIDGEERKVIDLSNKTMVFPETANPETIRKLMSIMAHDKNGGLYKVTDKNEAGQNEVMTATIQGFPTFIFCTVDAEINRELSTRCGLVAPQISAEKHRGAINIQNEARGVINPFLNDDEAFIHKAQNAFGILRDEFDSAIVAIPNIKTMKIDVGEDPRIMRDNPKRLDFIEACTRLHAFQRVGLTFKKDGIERKTLFANQFDIDVGTFLFNEISVATKTGIAPVVMEFWKEIITPLSEENNGVFGYKDLANRYMALKKEPINGSTLRKHRIKPLIDAGYISSDNENPDAKNILLNVIAELPTTPDENKVGTNGRFENAGSKMEEEYKRWLIKGLNLRYIYSYTSRGVCVLCSLETSGASVGNQAGMEAVQKIIKKEALLKQEITEHIYPSMFTGKIAAYFIDYYLTRTVKRRPSEAAIQERPLVPTSLTKETKTIVSKKVEETPVFDSKTSRGKETKKNVCDSCGTNTETTECDGEWLCDDCITAVVDVAKEDEKEYIDHSVSSRPAPTEAKQ